MHRFMKAIPRLKKREIVLIAIALFLLGMLIGTIVAHRSPNEVTNWEAISALGTLLGALLSAITAAIAAWIAWKSYQSSQRSSLIAETALNADRAWLISGQVKAEYEENSGSLLKDLAHNLTITIPIKNHGHSPALNVQVITEFNFGDWQPDEGLGAFNGPVRRKFSAIVPGETELVTITLVGQAALAVIKSQKNCNIDLNVQFYDIFASKNTPQRHHSRAFSVFCLNIFDKYIFNIYESRDSFIG